ncbi:MAG: MerR family transcriptional regulator [Deltaproteobacteria bacterium]|nr:MerR family transcriptional regulator [Deltaproteobacteria bacterium]
MDPVRLPLAQLTDTLPDAPPAPERLLQVGDLARESGKTVRALHLYEELGLLSPHARSKGRYRLFGPEALLRVRWIGKLQEMGLSLSEVADLVRDWESSESAPRAMDKMRRLYEERLRQTREQLTKLLELERELESSLKYLSDCDSCDPVRSPVQCTGCDLHDCAHPAPELVLGVQQSG